MKNKIILFTMLMFAPLANATQFKSVIDSMSISSNESQTNNSWEDTLKIKGVNWEWPYHESGAHDHTMKGKTKVGNDRNPNIGATNIIINGARTFITDIQISISNEEHNISILGAESATRIRTSCDDESLSNTVHFYKFERQNYKPLYISYISSWGAGGMSGSVDFKIAYQIQDVLYNYSESCKTVI